MMEFVEKKQLPQQQIECDSGVFVAWFVDSFVHNNLNLFEQPLDLPKYFNDTSNMRKKMCYGILEKAGVEQSVPDSIFNNFEDNQEEEDVEMR